MLAPLKLQPTEAPIERHPEWYVLQTEPQREHTVNGYLIGRRYRTYLPVVPVTTTRGVRRTKVQVLKPMFRGYLFIHLDQDVDGLGSVHSAPGFHRFLRHEADGAYAVIKETDLRRVRQEEEKENDPKAYVSKFVPGEQVRVSEGAFSGFSVEISELGDEERITVLVSMLGRSVRWHTNPLNLEKL